MEAIRDPVPPFTTDNPLGIIGDSQDKRFTFVRDDRDPNSLFIIDWQAVPEHWFVSPEFPPPLRRRPR